MRGLSGRAVLVTGAARGIGRAIAQRLAQEGCAVGVLDLELANAERAAAELRASGARAAAFAADVSDYAAVERAVAAFDDEGGGIAGLVNNAGWDRPAQKFAETDPAAWQRIVDVNFYGPLNATRAVLPRLLARGRGRIVFIASDAGRVGSGREAVYSGCKGGVIAFAKAVAREVARSGVTLNCVAPGPTETALLAGIDPTGKLQQSLARGVPMGRIGQPDDLAGAVAFLLSDDAGYVTGQTLSVSGGLTMA
ncbi:MAG TPA: glucose 1-dehydrogenase [Myxococcota bacterium]|nr:glucose 1-dehydrogenase [Myxococcota bacterium]